MIVYTSVINEAFFDLLPKSEFNASIKSYLFSSTKVFSLFNLSTLNSIEGTPSSIKVFFCKLSVCCIFSYILSIYSPYALSALSLLLDDLIIARICSQSSSDNLSNAENVPPPVRY